MAPIAEICTVATLAAELRPGLAAGLSWQTQHFPFSLQAQALVQYLEEPLTQVAASWRNLTGLWVWESCLSSDCEGRWAPCASFRHKRDTGKRIKEVLSSFSLPDGWMKVAGKISRAKGEGVVRSNWSHRSRKKKVEPSMAEENNTYTVFLPSALPWGHR